jgi:prepilin-type N-terminal cleavage/methylation domain-containing protein
MKPTRTFFSYVSPNRTVQRGTAGSRAGFTLLEIVAVLAIMAILAATLLPAVLSQIDRAARTKEQTDLAALGDALESAVRRTRIIPGHTNWTAILSEETQKGAAVLANTPRNLARAYLVDPDCRLAGANLPYVQTTNGTAQPVSARLMMVASLSGALPVNSGIPSATAFNEIWNTPAGTVPASWNTYSGQGQDVIIHRLPLRPLFHRLLLLNNDLQGTGRFSIDGSPSRTVPTNGMGWDSFYINGTVVGLHGTDGSLQCRELLTEDASFVFEFGYWRAQLHEGRLRPSRGLQFAAAVQQFKNDPWNAGADFGGTQQAVVDSMYFVLFIYTLWANDVPCFARNGSVNLSQTPHYKMFNDAVVNLSGTSFNLLK